LGIYRSGNHEQIRPAVIVEIDDARAPASVMGFYADLGGQCDIVKFPLPSLR
jgi:hypothetical protein